MVNSISAQAVALKKLTCRTCGIVKPDSWEDCSASVVNHLNTRKTIRVVEKGAILFHEGDEVTSMFRLLQGVVLLRKGDQDGNSVVTRMLTPAVTFGFRAFTAKERHSVTAQCATDITVCCIPADVAETAFNNNRSLERVFAQHVALELDYAETAILAHMKLSVYDRIILLFDQLTAEFGVAAANKADCDEWIVPVPVFRCDIAAMAGIARESFSRSLAKIEGAEIVLFVGSTIHIPSMRRFRAVVEQVRAKLTTLSPPGP